MGNNDNPKNQSYKTINIQLRQIYLDQQKRKKEFEEKRKRLNKYKGCCFM